MALGMGQEVSEATAKMGLEVLKSQLEASESGNVLFSPASLMNGLAMLYYGLGDPSRQALKSSPVINFPDDEASLKKQFQVFE